VNEYLRRPAAGRPAAAAIAAALAAVLLGGCVSLPTSGPVRVTNGLNGAAGPAQPGVHLVPVPPGTGWSAAQVVQGFLAASGAAWTGTKASLGIAQKYLSGNGESWHPSWSATVLDPGWTVRSQYVSSKIAGGGPPIAQVSVVSQHFQTLISAGQYQAGTIVVSPRPRVFQFGLIKVAGQWRIYSMPSRTRLLLSEADFLRDYQSRNLYFFPAGSAAQVLIPDPVFIPQQAGTQAAAQGLVNALLPPGRSLTSSAGWLSDATTTAFPRGTRIDVQVSGIKAIVDLTGAAAKASQWQLRRMAAQLAWTLTSTSYSASPGIQSVVIMVNQHQWSPDGPGAAASGADQPLLLKDYTGWVPTGAGSPYPLYFQAARPAGPEISEWQGRTSPAPLPSTLADVPYTATAVSSGPGQAFFAGCRGKKVYIAALRRHARTITQTLPAAAGCTERTALSWDQKGDLWVPAGHGVLIMPAAGPGQTVVAAPDSLTAGTVTSVQVAPDGVRVAMIVHPDTGGKHSVQIVVAAISRTSSNTYLAQSGQTVTVGSGIADPIALSWWDPDHLLVLGESRNANLALSEVPLNGNAPAQVPILLPPGVTSLTARQPYLVVGTAGEFGPPQIEISRLEAGGPWRLIAAGTSPVYPG